ncbi:MULTISPECIES: hypothetical protein [unclassified Lysobacter]|uniref:hypothetical protein n=1 Tax=unclassified Lysobacter TaxID=2635362 RepID=UPI001BEBDFB0|nr:MULTISPECIES: hypothetical protein [unclassified Lysobacter]MBT2747149.1 hypothetical protein [Lysobacter sp. ISL-42]MBT2752955.1 hypothetical protein [Lysobacter sp. ISL-50]MBT2778884.1 hypothetical protein [Lysobacter sp. ISL-54]MBT2784222.1 hypothetical protein [Lysobacter sp. ISL-52]
MSKSTDALTAFLSNWEQLKERRPAEGDFGTYGYPLSYASMDELFGRWKQTLATLDDRGYWTTSPEVGIADAPLAAQLNNLSSLVSSAASNGVSWLLSAQFLDVSHNVQSQLSALTRRQASLNKEVAKLLADRSAESMESVVAAATAAKRILDLSVQVEGNAKQIAEATTTIESANALAESTNTRLATLAKEADDNTIIVNESKSSIDKSNVEVAELKKQAVKREGELAKRVEEIDKFLADTDESAKKAYKSVEDALRKVRDQGLAKSFPPAADSGRGVRTRA